MKFKILNESKFLTEATNTSFEAFITNLGKFNEIGADAGKWVSFPISVDEFNKVLNDIGCNEPGYEEWFVADYDSEVDAYEALGEYPSFEELNKFAEMIDDEAFEAILEDQIDFESAKDIYESGRYQFYPGIYDLSDFAQFFIDETGGIDSLDEDTLESYFDYEALGRDIDSDTYESPRTGEDLSAGEYWCEDENATEEEIGYAYVAAVGFEGVSNPGSYFDYDAYGRDLGFKGYTVTNKGILYTY